MTKSANAARPPAFEDFRTGFRINACGFAGSLQVVNGRAARSITTEHETGLVQSALINAVIERIVPALINALELLDRFRAKMLLKDEARFDPWIASRPKPSSPALPWASRVTRMLWQPSSRRQSQRSS